MKNNSPFPPYNHTLCQNFNCKVGSSPRKYWVMSFTLLIKPPITSLTFFTMPIFLPFRVVAWIASKRTLRKKHRLLGFMRWRRGRGRLWAVSHTNSPLPRPSSLIRSSPWESCIAHRMILTPLIWSPRPAGRGMGCKAFRGLMNGWYLVYCLSRLISLL